MKGRKKENFFLFFSSFIYLCTHKLRQCAHYFFSCFCILTLTFPPLLWTLDIENDYSCVSCFFLQEKGIRCEKIGGHMISIFFFCYKEINFFGFFCFFTVAQY